MRFIRPCFVAEWVFNDALFRIKTNDRVLYLTFDDGPDPVITPGILDILAKHNIRATFFCSGAAAEKHYGLIRRIASEGHVIGNHGYDHPDGWKTPLNAYLEDVARASEFTSGKLFRPPYGHLRINQYRHLKHEYKIVFWDIMPYDFESSFGRGRSLKILNSYMRSGSIIVMHDNSRSCSHEFLEKFIISASDKGYRFENSIFNIISGQ
jgi:peptidoglycan-N-acetylglucosamine deacetylase